MYSASDALRGGPPRGGPLHGRHVVLAPQPVDRLLDLTALVKHHHVDTGAGRAAAVILESLAAAVDRNRRVLVRVVRAAIVTGPAARTLPAQALGQFVKVDRVFDLVDSAHGSLQIRARLLRARLVKSGC
jgi:hypothetical protein